MKKQRISKRNTLGVPGYFVLTGESFSVLLCFTTQPLCALHFTSEVTHPAAADCVKKNESFATPYLKVSLSSLEAKLQLVSLSTVLRVSTRKHTRRPVSTSDRLQTAHKYTDTHENFG